LLFVIPAVILYISFLVNTLSINLSSFAPFPHPTSEATELLRSLQYVNWAISLIVEFGQLKAATLKDLIYLAYFLYTGNIFQYVYLSHFRSFVAC
jgi:hypothetical protein